MIEELKIYENKKPEIVFEWKDPESEAEGWVVINSLRGGAAGGGTRMRKGLDKREVESLAKTMEIKFTVSGPSIGGAKSGINFDPSDPRKKEVLSRWFKAVIPILKKYYGTGGDLNIDELNDVIPITVEYGLLHPQEGIVNGHLLDLGKDEKITRIAQLQKGVSKKVQDKEYLPLKCNKEYAVADLITGYGVSESVCHFYDIYKESVKDKKVIIQGWGNVAATAGLYLSKKGAKVVGIIDRVGGLINEQGFTLEEIERLFINREGNTLSKDTKNMLSFDEINTKIWNIGAQIFIPAAASRIVSLENVKSLINNNLELIACGANVPFADKEIFFGPIAQYVDSKISLIPDFIANCGMARVFAYLMQGGIEIDDKAIFSDVSETIKKALVELSNTNKSKTNLSESAFKIALKKLSR